MDRPIKFEPWLELIGIRISGFPEVLLSEPKSTGRRIVSFPGRESTMKQEAEAVQPETLIMTVSMVLDQKRLQRFKPPSREVEAVRRQSDQRREKASSIRME
jgi:hypothetical protein